jgi:riboflavin synthase
MANSVKKGEKLAALIKKAAQKLLQNPKSIEKQLKKLALTLPLLALLIEEVKAAQNKIAIDATSVTAEVFEDEKALADFIDAQKLDETQYADVEQELQDVLLAKVDDAEPVAHNKAASIVQPEDGAGQSHLFGDGGMSMTEEERAVYAPADPPIEPAGLPLAGVPAVTGLLGAAAGAIGAAVIANNRNNSSATTTPAKTAQADSVSLSTTLKELVKSGVVYVTPATGQNTITLALGDDTALANSSGVPLFGDTNQNSVLTQAEDDSLSVTLTIDSAAQLTEVANLSGLASLGIDNVQINLSNQSLLDALLTDSALASDLATIRANGLSIDTIDMGSTVSISESQAATLISSGVNLHFASDDTINLQANSGTGTHLSTSLKDLQKLGVDAVTAVGGVGHVVVDFDSATSPSSSFTSTGLPSFDTGLDVTLNVNATQLSQVTTSASASALAAAHVDNVHINLVDVVGTASGFADELTTLLGTSGLSNLNTAHLNTTIDLVGSGAVSISQAQANVLVADGLHFASDDTITLQANSGTGTHLSTSLKDLQKLGVDAVTAVGGVGHVAVDFDSATSPSSSFTSTGLPLFTTGLDVTLNVNATQLSQVTAVATDLASAHVDNVHINLADVAGSASGFADELTTLLGTSGLSNLNTAHLNTTIDLVGSGAVSISQAQANVLVADGLHFASDDTITLQANSGTGTHLSTSLKDLQKLGVDAVTAVGGVGHVAVDFDSATSPSSSFTSTGLPLFTTGLDVTLNVNATQLSQVTAVATDLASAHVDNVHINLADVAGSASGFADELTTLLGTSGLSNLNTAHLNTTIDLVGSGAVSISQAQADVLVADGLHFASDDMIDLHVAATGTHMHTSLQDLQKLGVDSVSVDAGVKSVSIDFASGQALAATPILVGDKDHNGLIDSLEDSALDVTVDVHNLHDLSTVTSLATQFANAGVDHLGLLASDFNDVSLTNFLDAMKQAGGKLDYNFKFDSAPNSGGILVELLNHGIELSPGGTWSDFIHAMHDTGMANIDLVNPTHAPLPIPDSLTAALYESGMLHALPSANVQIVATNPVFNTTHQALDTSLQAMANLGVDSVFTDVSVVNKFYVSLGHNADLASIIAGFTDGSQAPTQGGLFGTGKEAGLVVDQTTFDHFGQLGVSGITNLLTKLSSLGFTEIDVLKGAADSQAYHINITPQTPVLATPVTLLGTDAQALHDVFAMDILDKKIS